jgi:hypothetical protein
MARLLVATDIDLDPQSGAARYLDLGNRAVGGHVLRLGPELLARAQIEGARHRAPSRRVALHSRGRDCMPPR